MLKTEPRLKESPPAELQHVLARGLAHKEKGERRKPLPHTAMPSAWTQQLPSITSAAGRHTLNKDYDRALSDLTEAARDPMEAEVWVNRGSIFLRSRCSERPRLISMKPFESIRLARRIRGDALAKANQPDRVLATTPTPPLPTADCVPLGLLLSCRLCPADRKS